MLAWRAHNIDLPLQLPRMRAAAAPAKSSALTDRQSSPPNSGSNKLGRLLAQAGRRQVADQDGTCSKPGGNEKYDKHVRSDMAVRQVAPAHIDSAEIEARPFY
jgi:hypothetical protein